MGIILRLVAALGAAAHVYFFYREAIEWKQDFIEKVAPSWIKEAKQINEADRFMRWTKMLAVNMGSYNLILAIGLAWVTIGGPSVAGTLGIFLAVWLLGAAAAAAYTKVMLAFYAQGALGVLLLILAIATRQ
jgi:uncharacterized membrane protein